MRNLTQQERRLCSLQGALFEASVDESDSSSAVFVRRFMLSDFARRLDSAEIVVDTSPPAQVIAEIDAEFGARQYGRQKYSRNEMHWMGYLYRCLCILTGLSSRAVYRLVGARELRDLHYPYHSLGIEQAAERILEERGRTLPNTSIEYGVIKLREIRERRG